MSLKASNESINTFTYPLILLTGRPMNVDMFSFTQGDTKRISYLSQSLGLMAELDIGTESWRWMGDTRFYLGFLWGRKTRSPHMH